MWDVVNKPFLLNLYVLTLCGVKFHLPEIFALLKFSQIVLSVLSRFSDRYSRAYLPDVLYITVPSAKSRASEKIIIVYKVVNIN